MFEIRARRTVGNAQEHFVDRFGAAVHWHERSGGSAGQRVQLACNRFDAGAGLGDEEDASIDSGNAADQFADTDNRRRRPDELRRRVARFGRRGDLKVVDGACDG